MHKTDIVLFGFVAISFLALAAGFHPVFSVDPIARIAQRDAAHLELAGPAAVAKPRSNGQIILEHYSKDEDGRPVGYTSTLVLEDQSMVFFRAKIRDQEYLFVCSEVCWQASLQENKGKVHFLDSRVVIIFSEEDFDPETKSGGEPRVIWYNR